MAMAVTKHAEVVLEATHDARMSVSVFTSGEQLGLERRAPHSGAGRKPTCEVGQRSTRRTLTSGAVARRCRATV